MQFMLAENFIQVYVLVVFRLAGMMIFAPFFGSSRVSRRLRVLLCLVLAAGLADSVALPGNIPDTMWGLAVAIGAEMMFGLAMGMILSLIFIAAQWAGEIVGQQMGFNLGEVFDPQFGAQSSVVGEMFYMLTLVIFLAVGGHHAMLIGVFKSFQSLPLLSVFIGPDLLTMLLGVLMGATTLAIQLAAPVLLTMLVIDLALGIISKTMPQINVMTAGISLRSLVGTAVLVAGMSLTAAILQDKLLTGMDQVVFNYGTPAQPPEGN